LGPRRIFAALAVLALAVLMVTAGAGFASDLTGVGDGHHNGWHGNDTEADAAGGGGSSGGGPSASGGDSGGEVDGAGAGSGSGSGQGSGGSSGGDVTGSGAGTPSAPVEAPAVAVSGPAPDAATAAPVLTPAPGPATDVFVPAVGSTDAPGAALPATDAASVAGPALPPSDLAGLDHVPVLGSIGSVAKQVTDGPSAARELLSTGTGQSLAVILSLLGAIAVFLAVHRRTDRGDRKLAAARTGPEVARFR
jgi:hypothetical protein